MQPEGHSIQSEDQFDATRKYLFPTAFPTQEEYNEVNREMSMFIMIPCLLSEMRVLVTKR